MAELSLDKPPALLRYDDGTMSFLLRPARVADAERLIAAMNASLPELRRFMPWAHVEQTVEIQRERLAGLEVAHRDGGEYGFHLMSPDEGELWGSFGLHPRTLNPRALELGYWVRTDQAGRGLATVASKCLTVLCLDHFGLERFQAAYNEANVASGRVQQKVGFREEARLRCFAQTPTAEQRAAGMATQALTVITALFREDRPRLDWWAGVSANLVIAAV